jgi:hypothetical protein
VGEHVRGPVRIAERDHRAALPGEVEPEQVAPSSVVRQPVRQLVQSVPQSPQSPLLAAVGADDRPVQAGPLIVQPQAIGEVAVGGRYPVAGAEPGRLGDRQPAALFRRQCAPPPADIGR